MGHILKSEDIQIDGRFALSSDGQAHPPSDGAGGVDQVRVISQQADYTVIEVVCSCGQTLRLRCEHPA